MDRPENGLLITPKILKKVDGTYVTLIRRLVFQDSYIVGKSVLSRDGQWITVLEDTKYPEECLLVSPVTDEEEEIKKEKEWQLSKL